MGECFPNCIPRDSQESEVDPMPAPLLGAYSLLGRKQITTWEQIHLSYGRIKEGGGRFGRENIINWRNQLSDTHGLRRS